MRGHGCCEMRWSTCREAGSGSPLSAGDGGPPPRRAHRRPLGACEPQPGSASAFGAAGSVRWRSPLPRMAGTGPARVRCRARCRSRRCRRAWFRIARGAGGSRRRRCCTAGFDRPRALRTAAPDRSLPWAPRYVPPERFRPCRQGREVALWSCRGCPSGPRSVGGGAGVVTLPGPPPGPGERRACHSCWLGRVPVRPRPGPGRGDPSHGSRYLSRRDACPGGAPAHAGRTTG